MILPRKTHSYPKFGVHVCMDNAATDSTLETYVIRFKLVYALGWYESSFGDGFSWRQRKSNISLAFLQNTT